MPLAHPVRLSAVLLGLILWPAGIGPVAAQTADSGWDRDDRAIAERFAPVFHQGMVGTRFDFITNFDFDGDWVGDNNWLKSADPKYPQKGYVYYAVSETATHYFVHYAAFHPRDYKGGALTGEILSEAVRRGAQASARVRNTSIADDVVLAHENDLEGCLVVAEKRGASLGDARIVFVETMAHNRYLKFQLEPTLTGDVGTFRTEGEQPLIYVEPQGHGMEAFDDQLTRRDTAQDGEPAASGRVVGTSGSASSDSRTLAQRVNGMIETFNKYRKAVNLEGAEQIRIYRYTGTADDPEQGTGDIGYDLLPLYETIWARARRGPNETFGEMSDYGSREISVAGTPETKKSVKLGSLGSSFRGVAGAENKARPPWGWFDMTERGRPLGEWFFDPAAVINRHFPTAKVATAYVHQPFLGVIRSN